MVIVFFTILRNINDGATWLHEADQKRAEPIKAGNHQGSGTPSSTSKL